MKNHENGKIYMYEAIGKDAGKRLVGYQYLGDVLVYFDPIAYEAVTEEKTKEIAKIFGK